MVAGATVEGERALEKEAVGSGEKGYPFYWAK